MRTTLIAAMLAAVMLTVAPAVAAPPAAAQGPAPQASAATSDVAKLDPVARIRAIYDRIQAIMKSDAPLVELRAQVEKLTDTFVDYRELARLTVKEQWPQWSDARREEFVDLFKQLIRRTYAKKFKRDPDLTVVFEGGAEFRKGRARVRTTVTSGGTSVEVEYRMYQPADRPGWWVYDIVIDDVSLRRNYRSQFQRILRKEGVDALFRKLREKAEAAPQ